MFCYVSKVLLELRAAQAGLILVAIFLPQSPKDWDDRHVTPSTHHTFFYYLLISL